MNFDEIHGQVEFSQAFAPFNIFDHLNVVQSHVQVVQFLKLVEVLQLLNDVVLHVNYLQVTTKLVQVLDFYQLALVQRYLL